MRAKAIGPLLFAVAVAALLLPALASAKASGHGPDTRGVKPWVAESFEVRGTNGYTVTVDLKDRRRLTLGAAGKGHGLFNFSGVSYAMPYHQPSGSDDIVTRIGKLGRIDVRFVPKSVTETRLPRGCVGGKKVTEEGHFVGVISFTGERGYTRVRARHAAGTIVRSPRETCKKPPAKKHDKAVEKEEAEANIPEPEEAEVVGLIAAASHPRVALVAERIETESSEGKTIVGAVFIGAAVRHRGPIKETALTFEVGLGKTAFVLPDLVHPTTEAVIEPPAPFSGSATYRRKPPKSTTWSGNLKVELPGFGNVPLAGHGSRAAMCSDQGCGKSFSGGFLSIPGGGRLLSIHRLVPAL